MQKKSYPQRRPPSAARASCSHIVGGKTHQESAFYSQPMHSCLKEHAPAFGLQTTDMTEEIRADLDLFLLLLVVSEPTCADCFDLGSSGCPWGHFFCRN